MKIDEGTMGLVDGEATIMGDGVAVVVQRDDKGCVHNVVLQRADLEALLAAL
ncbi:hypothetical protein [Sphingomonas phyllosphaerae]|uniref:hypothetical protein n=1 Tax=Sphingomonas phyllosphaerae TaxID=257003 RepID=UPI0003B37D68|nr:hypothetical protein [Sphingomonas phyllosphaerae]